MDDEIDSILALIDELKAEDHGTRLHAINSLHLIARAIGHERTREELVPYISELLEDENEEMLMALASKLGELAGAIGELAHVACLLPPLHSLATNEDNAVRGKAVDALNVIAAQLPPTVASTALLPVIQSLASSDWFSAKISACHLVHVPFRKFSDSVQKELVEKLIELGKDDTPMVRRAAGANLGQLVQQVQHTGLMELFTALSKDEHDSVRQTCLESMINVLPQHPELIATIKSYAKDKSWRVRYAYVEHLREVLDTLDSAQDFVDDVLSLMNDNEPEVRSVVLGTLQFLMQKIPEQLAASQLLPVLEKLSKDPSQYVRLSLMQALCELAQYFGPERSVTSLLPLVSHLIHDENFEVRMSFAEHITVFNAAIGPDNVVTFVIPILTQMMTDPQWRVRLKVVECIPHLGEILGEEKFNEHVSGTLMKWVEDPVYAIRESTLEAFKHLASLFGSEWASIRVLPFLKILSASPVFRKRMTVLKSVNRLAPLLDQKEVLRVLRKMAGDPVPNIKFGVARTFIELREYFTETQEVKAILGLLKDDGDFDVRHFTSVALSSL